MIHLYVKRHKVTGLLYFGKTTKTCPYSYMGSGRYWLRHLKVHGKDVETLSVWTFDDPKECSRFAMIFSKENDITSSDAWANLRPENGTDGTVAGTKFSPESSAKKSQALTGRKRGATPTEVKEKISKSLAGRTARPHSEMTKLKQSISARGEANPNFGKPLSDEAKANLSRKNKGRVVSEETKQKMREARLAYYAARR